MLGGKILPGFSITVLVLYLRPSVSWTRTPDGQWPFRQPSLRCYAGTELAQGSGHCDLDSECAAMPVQGSRSAHLISRQFPASCLTYALLCSTVKRAF
ncbi:hypothetical protein DFH11DRAFT_1632324, partial [Phellopilus nigrolimitatus]